ncbi:DNA binding domain [uncultured Mediterranean phage uvMED]|nr:hypothetical protein [uncultured phage MedDCM-OCT-S12-C102]BAQ84355.1 DNA binding domain [uncultured Mediterranean phage uvMED]BAQ84450.1 DNA binding domain [uncultured Mediterranean phage uvMED]BAQ84499.1 DNA binding domain [uncultured Mediterranean phage uvMED]BAQ84557.1 DNA binding domain [uncultured Mediterranean phage uvMED]
MPKGSLTKFNNRSPSSHLQHYTGEQLKKHDPKRYDSIVMALKEGISPESIAKILYSSLQTVRGIAREEKTEAISKATLKHKVGLISDMMLDQVLEHLKEGTLNKDKLPVNTAIFIDKLMMLANDGASVVKHIKVDATPDKLNELIDNLPEASKPIEVEVVTT